MQKLTTPAGVFGPYSTILTLGERYRCDGGDLPFSVVGTGTIDDWTGERPEPTPTVPKSVTNVQARLAMLNAGLLDDATSAVEAMGPAALIEWEHSVVIHRDSPLVAEAASALGLTDDQVDALFIAAAAL